MLGFFMRVRANEIETDLSERIQQPKIRSSKPMFSLEKSTFSMSLATAS
ncbi:hypothetical protein RESH_05198 [Rhodopirellula europaea SH398]|uniref:Uncharacterized protein n=1 Tax=Rhodopirellula europaea SH398 TaxID=1263868 RepID=M5RXW8_9BACT|nr:hypothetical protein RESH_05198 [Rhodopirellula europaea SH398]